MNEKLIKLNEAIDKPFTTKEEIENWLKEMRIKNYVINDDLTVDVDGDVNLTNMRLKIIPVKFNKVYGNFNFPGNKLTTLVGAPKEVGGYFDCSNNQLTTLEGAPEKIGGSLRCDGNQLIVLVGAPKEVGGYFDCSGNKLTTLEGAPEKIGSDFNCTNNNLSICSMFDNIDYSIEIDGMLLYIDGNETNYIPNNVKINEGIG